MGDLEYFRAYLLHLPSLMLVFATVVLISSAGCSNDEDTNVQESDQAPEGKLEMHGDIGEFIPDEIDDPVHDPSLIKKGDIYYVFSTGILRDEEDPGGIYIRKSEGTLEGPWESVGEVPVPKWVYDYNPSHLWAPQSAENNGTYYLYYAASTFGTNNSAIGVASSDNPGDPDSWEDHGPVIVSQEGEVDYNALDPHVFEAEGAWWIAFGSHFSGIKLKEMESMTEVGDEVYTLQNRPETEHNPVEAPTIIENDDYYYLFTSWDQCCSGTDSTYKIAVGRSESVTGPYEDKNGVQLEDGGGHVILEEEGNQIGPGGQDILEEYGNDYLIHHYYDGDADGVIRMQIRTLTWEDGWPSVDED